MLDYLERKFLFRIKAIQIDDGSEFKKDFEEACQKKGILLFVLPPPRLRLNGHVERANVTHRQEFYEVEEIELSLREHNKQLEREEYIYNYIRPHQALDYLTPDEYYQEYIKKEVMCYEGSERGQGFVFFKRLYNTSMKIYEENSDSDLYV